MFKAVKECMRNWVMTHKRLYWYIVIGIAALAFGIVTGMGCAKLERAEAAVEETIVVPWYGNDVALDLNGYPYYAVFYGTGVTGDTKVFLSWAPVISQNDTCTLFGRADGELMEIYGFYSDSNLFESNDFASSCSVGNYTAIRSNYTIYNRDGSVFHEANPFDPSAYIETVYSPDAPYVVFDSASLSNLYLDGKPKLFHIGSTFDNKTKSSAWGFTGHLSEWDVTGATEYKLHIEYSVELPTWEYVKQLCEIKEIPYYGWDTCDASAELRHVWDTNENIPKYVYNFIYPINFNNDSGASEGGYIDLNTGLINFYLSFEQIEALIQYFNEDAYSELRNDAAYEENAEEIRAHYLSYLHIDQVRVVVHADTVGSSVYGPMSVFSFQRDMKKAPLQKVVNVDYLTEIKDSVDDAVNENLMDGLEEYYKDLQTQLDDLQNQIDDIYSVGEGFGGHLEDTDLWSGFQNLAEGLGSLGPSVANISVLTGQVLSFLPLPISNIMYFTIFALCVVAIIKAIRG